MTVNTELARAEFAWTGVESAFAAGFPADQAADVGVFFRTPAGVITTLLAGVNYSVTLASGSKLVTVVPITLPAAPGTIVIRRSTPALVTDTLQDGEGFSLEIIQRLHDLAAMRSAEDRDILERAIKLDEGAALGEGNFDLGGSGLDNLAPGTAPNSAATVGQLLDLITASGNVPAPLVGDVGLALVALAGGQFGWDHLDKGALVDGFLSADEPGRLKMADGFLTLAKLADGILSADVAGRLKMADKFVTLAKQADIATAVIMGRATAGLGSQEPLTGAQALRVITAAAGSVSGVRNLLVNASFLVNQRAYSGAALTAGSFGYDRWKADAGGATYSVSGGVMTILAGTVVQVIDGADILVSGTHVIDWTGTATCSVDGVAKTKGSTFALTAGTNCTVKFTGGTVSLPQIEPGDVPTAFETRPASVEVLLCRRFYQTVNWLVSTVATAASQDIYGVVNFQPMRATPTVTRSNGSFTSCALIASPVVTPTYITDFARSTGSAVIYAGYTALLSADI